MSNNTPPPPPGLGGSFGGVGSRGPSTGDSSFGGGFGVMGRDGGGFGSAANSADRQTIIGPSFLPADPAGGFGQPRDVETGGTISATPPKIWLILGCVAAAAGLALGLLFSEPQITIPAWLLAGPAAIGLLTVYILRNTKSQAAPIYSVPTLVPWLYRGLLLLALAGVLISGWRIALWVGHL